MLSTSFAACEPAALGLLHTGWLQTPYSIYPGHRRVGLFVFVASFLESSLTDSPIIIDVHYGMLGMEPCSFPPI